jgi:hypothetical protein
MTRLAAAFSTLFLLIAASAEAQPSVLPAKTPVPLLTLADLDSRSARQGDRFELEVRDDVTVGGLVAIPKGSRAWGEIIRSTGTGSYGRSGKLELRLLHLTVDRRNIRLDGDERLKGQSAAEAAVVTSAVWGLIGAFVTGKNARLPAGTEIIGFTHRDVPLAPPAD